jgi:hypothetical protein
MGAIGSNSQPSWTGTRWANGNSSTTVELPLSKDTEDKMLKTLSELLNFKINYVEFFNLVHGFGTDHSRFGYVYNLFSEDVLIASIAITRQKAIYGFNHYFSDLNVKKEIADLLFSLNGFFTKIEASKNDNECTQTFFSNVSVDKFNHIDQAERRDIQSEIIIKRELEIIKFGDFI